MSDALTSFLDEPNSSFEKAMNKRQEAATMANELKHTQWQYWTEGRYWKDCTKEYAESLAKINVNVREINTRRAAPVEGLETVAFDLEEIRKAVFGDVGDEPDVYSDYDYLCELSRKMRGAIRFCSLAEAIIAAERAKNRELSLMVNDASKDLYDANVQNTELKAENAALTARVKELKSERDHWKSNHDCVVGKYRLATQRPDLPVDRLPAIRKLEALETQLAAARKVFEFFTDASFDDALVKYREFQDRAALEVIP